MVFVFSMGKMKLRITIAVIAVMLFVVVPTLFTLKVKGFEAKTVDFLIDLCIRQARFYLQTNPSEYGSLSDLYPPGFPIEGLKINYSENTIIYSGYRIKLTVKDAPGKYSASTYTVIATPIMYNRSGHHSFYLDQSGIIRVSSGKDSPADETSPAYKSIPIEEMMKNKSYEGS